MKLCAVTLLCSVLAFACGAEECPTNQLLDLPAVCRNESAFYVPEIPTNEQLNGVSVLACVTCRGRPLYDYLVCTDLPRAEQTNVTCAKNENEDICYEALFPLDGTTTDINSVIENCDGSTIFASADCSMACQETLESWSKAAGCCITSFYELVNNSLLQALVSESFWMKCGVERPGTCTGAFSSSVPTADTSVPTEDTSVPTEDTSVPTEDTSVPTEDTSVPTAARPVPTEDSSVAMEASFVAMAAATLLSQIKLF